MSRHEQGIKERSWRTIGASLVAGGVAGGVSRTAVAPLERLKILMQVQGNERVYRGVVQGLVEMAKREGLYGMFKGNGVNCLRIIPNSAVKFFCYEQFSGMLSTYQQVRTGDGSLSPLLRLFAGSMAGIVAMSSVYPLEMVRGRLSIQETGNKEYSGIWDAMVKITRNEGFFALYKGMLPSIYGVVPYVGLNFAVYESLKVQLLKVYDLQSDKELSTVTRLGCGGVAGTIGQTVSYPFDVIRRRLQVSGWQGSLALNQVNGQVVVYKGMNDCFVKTIQLEGVQALFKGLATNYVKVVPSIAIAFITYEEVKELLGAEINISYS